MASEAESVVTAVGNTSAFGATTSSPPFTKDGLPLPPTEQHQFFKISTGGDRVARLVVFDLLRMAMLIETKQRGDVERDGKRRKSIRAESMQDLRRGPNSEIFKENIRLINDGEHEACFTVFYVHQGVNSNVNLSRFLSEALAESLWFTFRLLIHFWLPFQPLPEKPLSTPISRDSKLSDSPLATAPSRTSSTSLSTVSGQTRTLTRMDICPSRSS